jgi:hypothetical protein
MLLNRKDFLIALYKSGDVFVGVVRKSEDNVGPYKVDISEHGNLYVG